MNKHVLILGGGLMQRPAVEAAKKLNCHITLADANSNALCKDLVDVFEPVDLKDVDGLIKLAKKMKNSYGIDGVFTAGTDFSSSVAKVAQELNLPGHSVEAALNASDKTRMRQCFKQNGVASPNFVGISKKDLDDNSLQNILNKNGFFDDDYPLVVKPVDNMGGRGCKMVYNLEEAYQAIKIAIKYSRTQTAIVEEYMDGPEFSVDSIVYNDKIIITGLADRHIYYPPYFIEMGHTIPTTYGKEQIDMLLNTFKKGVKALGLTCGAAKGDLKLTPKGCMIGEIAARLSGGYMSGWTFPYASGIDLTEQLLRIALNMEPTIDINSDFIPCTQYSAEGAWLSIPGKVNALKGIDKAKAIPKVKEVFIRSQKSDEVVFPQNNVEKCGNIIASDNSYKKAQDIKNEAIKNITIILEQNNKNTEEFLITDYFCEYPPSAYKISQEAYKLILDLQENMVWYDSKSQNNDQIRIEFPECLKNYQHLKDWNNKTMTDSIEQFVDICKNFNLPQIKQKDFWKTFLRGGLQGILYIVGYEE